MQIPCAWLILQAGFECHCQNPQHQSDPVAWQKSPIRQWRHNDQGRIIKRGADRMPLSPGLVPFFLVSLLYICFTSFWCIFFQMTLPPVCGWTPVQVAIRIQSTFVVLHSHYAAFYPLRYTDASSLADQGNELTACFELYFILLHILNAKVTNRQICMFKPKAH